MRGRPPLPTPLKLLTGNLGKRPLNDQEPLFKSSAPVAPKELDKVARREWKRIAKLLAAHNMICDLDLAILAGYCHSFSLWVESSAAINRTGLLVKGRDGMPVASPYWKINVESKAQLLKFAQELGLSIVQRSRLKTGRRGMDEGLEDLLD